MILDNDIVRSKPHNSEIVNFSNINNNNSYLGKSSQVHVQAVTICIKKYWDAWDYLL